MYKTFIRPVLFKKDPEQAHTLISKRCEHLQKSPSALGMVKEFYSYTHPSLHAKVFGFQMRNPIGLAAGFDKYTSLIPFMSALGFGHLEVGTITKERQEGNPQPRMFRLPADKALINRMGFNNLGADLTVHQLQKYRRTSLPVGINIGKSKNTPLSQAVDDYLYTFNKLYAFGDYFVVNVSSPNTPGLRTLQAKPQLTKILTAVQQANYEKKPLLLKLAPDLTWDQVDDALSVVWKTKIDGIILTNTTIARNGLRTSISEGGGLSGKPITKKSTEFVAYVYKKTQGKIPLVGVGGVFTARDAYEKIRAGASLVQVYTGMIYEGPSIVKSINKGVVHLLKRDGFRTISEVIGSGHRK